ncbi:unnamed protein product [Nezara viridula]|uniref:Uncharacterized protein n=1 Tax=Nezara viridula TaxID=85310 RepID=A0A9P0HTH3_NEZVI|nr:unnamed protein product [Nezara viridula]
MFTNLDVNHTERHVPYRTKETFGRPLEIMQLFLGTVVIKMCFDLSSYQLFSSDLANERSPISSRYYERCLFEFTLSGRKRAGRLFGKQKSRNMGRVETRTVTQLANDSIQL